MAHPPQLPAATPVSTTDAQLVQAFWEMVAEAGWSGLSLFSLAERAGMAPEDLRARVPGRLTLLDLHFRVVDQAVLGGTVPDPLSSPRDRVFDVLMRRLDCLLPYRAGICRLLADLPRDPGLGVLLASRSAPSLLWMLEAAGLPSGGVRGALLAPGLAALWLSAVRAWSKDESEDLGTTMAALDKALDRAGRLVRMLRLEPGGAASAEAASMEDSGSLGGSAGDRGR